MSPLPKATWKRVIADLKAQRRLTSDERGGTIAAAALDALAGSAGVASSSAP